MRGKEGQYYGFDRTQRITPAHAGKRRSAAARSAAARDHPRPCGEKKAYQQRKLMLAGSPPPMRGKASSVSMTAGLPGITPAHAGKRWSQCLHRSRLWDLPRPCGEKTAAYTASCVMQGSPPPMRGKGNNRIVDNPLHRITPAHAGKSSCTCRISRPIRDHPRPCGEKMTV